MVAIKAQVDCLLGKLHQVGPGNRQLAKKRVWAIAEDQRMAERVFQDCLSEHHSSTIILIIIIILQLSSVNTS